MRGARHLRWWMMSARQRLLAGRAKGIILLYHRVAEGFDPLSLNVSPAHFAEHLQVVRSLGRPAPLSALVDDGRSDQWLLGVSFDDGYRDNLEVAAPLLEASDIPATVFVVTGNMDSGEEFWWDEIARLIFDERDVVAAPGWSVEEAAEPRPAYADFRAALERLRTGNSDERTLALTDLRGRKRDVHLPRRPVLTADEVARLSATAQLDVGAHTVRHPLLAGLDPAAQRDEIQRARERLTEILGHAPRHFAYPFGTPFDFDRSSMAAARAVGFEAAFANFPAPVGERSPRFAIPRILVRDWSGEELERRLSLFGGSR
jgi:peptidoglycan/xylan/chitin deacetylase (PgdA/CDA1 family)